MAGAIHHHVSAEAADEIAHPVDTGLRTQECLDVDRGLGAEAAGQLKPRLFRRADANNASGPHLLGGRDRENSDGPRALDHNAIPPAETAGPDRAIERPDARCQRFAKCAEPKRHVIGERVDLGAGQHVEIDIYVFGPTAPEMWRLLETEIAPVIN